MIRCARLCVNQSARAQVYKVPNRFPQPIRYSTWMNAHMTNAGKPTKFILPEAATARMRPIVAKLPLSKYLKGAAARITIQTRSNHLPDVLALLNRGLRDTRKSIERHHVTDREDLRMAGQGAVGFHRDSPRPVRRSARGLGEQTGQR